LGNRFDEEGLLTGLRVYYDNLGVLMQISAVPVPGSPAQVSLSASRYANISPSETVEAIVSLENVVHAMNFVVRMQFDPAALTPVLPTPDAVTVNTEVLSE